MATNRDLLKEAIADAKAVKEMAIANAKAALEEAFTPQLKSMLSAKLQEMEEEIDEDELIDENIYEEEEEMMDEELNLDELLNELNEEEEMESEEEEMESEEEGEPLDLEDMTDEDLKKLIEDVIADMVAAGELEAGEGAGEEAEEMEGEEAEDEEVDLDELLAEIADFNDDETNTIEELELHLKSIFPNSNINLKYDEEGDGIMIDGVYISEGAYQKWDTYIEMTDEEKSFMDDKSLIMYLKSKMNLEETLEEIFGLGKKTKRNFETVISQLLADNKDAVEAIAAEQDPATKKQMADPLLKKAFAEFKKLKAEGADADVIGNMSEFKRELFGDSRSLLQKLATGTKGSISIAREGVEKELKEAYNTIKTLRADLNEVNLLNAKLLYVNKLFNSSKNLTESQKLNILTSFDKASTVKEAKLVFETLNEGLKVKKTPIKESLGMASKAVGTTKTKQSIIESDPMVARFQKLAGII
jgi:hypothetical protein